MFIAKCESIRRKREEQELTMAQLSKKSGLPNNAVWRMENGIYRTQPLRAKALAEALRCKITDIFIDEKANQ